MRLSSSRIALLKAHQPTPRTSDILICTIAQWRNSSSTWEVSQGSCSTSNRRIWSWLHTIWLPCAGVRINMSASLQMNSFTSIQSMWISPQVLHLLWLLMTKNNRRGKRRKLKKAELECLRKLLEILEGLQTTSYNWTIGSTIWITEYRS